MIQHTRVHSISPTRLSSGSNKSSSSAAVVSTTLLPLLPSAVAPESTPYFHGKITREQAEDLLFAHGALEGLFLLRESVSRNYVISICHLNHVHHYNVERQSDGWYKIQTGPRFVGPVELVKHHTVHLDGFLTLARVPLKRKHDVTALVLQGLYIDELEQNLRLKAAEMGLKGPSVDEALSGPMRDHLRYLVLKELHTGQPWYHHTIKRREAERRLAEDGNCEGAFLVRLRKEDGSFVLSLCSHGEPKHYKIEEHLDRWSIEGGQYFETVMEMIDHYHHRQDGLLCKLRRPVWAPSFTRSRSGSSAVSKLHGLRDVSHLEHSAVQTNMSAAVNSWNGSQSLPSLCSVSMVAPTVHEPDRTLPATDVSHTGNIQVKDDLISFAEWPNVTRLLLNNAQVGHNPTSAITKVLTPIPMASIALNRFSVPLIASPTTPVADPLSDLTPTPSALPNAPILSKRLSAGSMNVLRPLHETNLRLEKSGFVLRGTDPGIVKVPDQHTPVNGCLQPIRMSTDPPVGRVTAEVNAAIANAVAQAFHSVAPGGNNKTAAFGNVTDVSADATSSKLMGCVFGSDRSLTETNNTDTTSVPYIPSQSLHFPPILDAPWEEPDGSEEFAHPGHGSCGVGWISSTPVLTGPSAVPASIPCTNPFLAMLQTNSVEISSKDCTTDSTNRSCDIIQHSHLSNVSSFCSTACCQANFGESPTHRSVWAKVASHESAQLIYDELPPSNFLLSSESVTLKERLGGGNFGHVVKGVFRTTSGQEVPVAVKTLKPCQIANAGEREILAEARTMAQLKHRHIVRLIGVCKDEQFMLVLELAPLGPINKYLKKRPDIPVHTLTELMYQVALGMAYLESCKFVHRDLAARNVLLVTRHFAKISDFGMSKALNFGSDYYRAATAGKWPLKWYAPECIYYFRFDSKSDVWSFGVTLWEVYSYGARPYRDMKGAQILAMLDQGLRLSKPARCPDSIYSVMQQCWHFEGVRRPTFAELVLTLSRILMPTTTCGTILVNADLVQTVSFNPTHQVCGSINGGSGGSGANSSVNSDGASF